MAKKMTKRERIEQKIADGLSRLDAEIEIAKEDAAERIARLERRQARERARIEARVVEIIRRDLADVWARAEDAARAELDAERAKRSEARRRAAESPMYGAWGEKNNYGKVSEGLIRSTVVIDEDGKVTEAQYNVRAKGHVDKLRRDLGLEAA